MAIVGIDLGTTFSAIAHLDDSGKPAIVPVSGERTLPSLVYVDREQGDRLVVGAVAGNMLRAKPEFVAGDFKRHMGRGKTLDVGGVSLTPIALSSVILKKLRQDFEAAVGKITHAVISVPAHFESNAREATLEAARAAGIPCTNLINEPTAAILTCSAAGRVQGNVLVYDLGGGTFDITAARVSGDDVKVLSTEGDLDLGGRDFDELIIRHASQEFEKKHGSPLCAADSPHASKRHWEAAEALKKGLSSLGEIVEVFSNSELAAMVEVKLTREELEDLIRGKLSKSMQLVDLVLENVEWSPDEVDRILLVGGSTRVPLVKELLANVFGAEKVVSAPSVDEAVALGAAIQAGLTAEADQLTRMQVESLGDRSLSEVTSMVYGTVTLAGSGELEVATIIPKDAPIPCKKKDTFYTTHAGQTEVNCRVTEHPYEESDPDLVKVKDSVTLHLPPGREAQKEIVVTYSYDANQCIHCEFVDVESGNKAEMKVDAGSSAKPKGDGVSMDFNLDDFVIE